MSTIFIPPLSSSRSSARGDTCRLADTLFTIPVPWIFYTLWAPPSPSRNHSVSTICHPHPPPLSIFIIFFCLRPSHALYLFTTLLLWLFFFSKRHASNVRNCYRLYVYIISKHIDHVLNIWSVGIFITLCPENTAPNFIKYF